MSVVVALIGTAVSLAVSLAVELIAPLGRVSWKSRVLGLQLTFVKAGAIALMVPVLSAGWQAMGVQPLKVASIGGIVGIGLSILAYDFLGYWHHRFLHRFFWPVHATHHSIRELSALNSYGHFAEKVTQFSMMLVPMSLVHWGSPAVPFVMTLVISLAEYWIHSPTTAQMNGLRAVLVTPRFHRIHHSLEAQHFDKNFGILFSFWDRMFGTAFHPGLSEWPDTGLEDHAEARNVWDYLVHPLTYTMKFLGPPQVPVACPVSDKSVVPAEASLEP